MRKLTHETLKLSIRRVKKGFEAKNRISVDVRNDILWQYESDAERLAGFATFEEFFEATYHRCGGYGYRLVNAAKTERSLAAQIRNYLPLTEYALFLLQKIPDDNKRAEIYRRAREKAGMGTPGTKQIREAAEQAGYVLSESKGTLKTAQKASQRLSVRAHEAVERVDFDNSTQCVTITFRHSGREVPRWLNLADLLLSLSDEDRRDLLYTVNTVDCIQEDTPIIISNNKRENCIHEIESEEADFEGFPFDEEGEEC